MIVNTVETYNIVCNILESKDTFIIPIPLSQTVHPRNSKISLLYVYDLLDRQSYLIPIDHPDSIKTFEIPTKIKKAYIPCKKDAISLGISGENLIDVEVLNYYNTGKRISLKCNQAQQFIERKFWKYDRNNTLVPILKLLEYCKTNRKQYIELIDDTVAYSPECLEYNRDITDVYSYLESNGINTTSGIEYTKYNLFTSTGRPSNTFNGINYAALNKEDGTRDRFISRFDNGMLVEFDFDSYHLRLISNLIGYTLPEGSVHAYLGKYYFEKDKLSKKEYEEAKQINFKILYGGVPKEFKNIEFFRLIHNFTMKLWSEWKSKSYVCTYLYKRRLHKDRLGEMNPQKLFNYYIQAYETEHNIKVIKRFKEVLATKKTKVVLCTYDSFLFDFNTSDGLDTLIKLKDLMNLPTKVSIGTNYGTMIDKSL